MKDQSQSENTEAQREPVRMRRIVLTGFMGSGKSTVGPLLAERLGWRFLDVDDVIEADAGMAIAELFARYGEAEFRKRENATIVRLAGEDALVLALGGGAIEHEGTRTHLLTASGTILIHLQVELETTLARCAGTEQVRPILADRATSLAATRAGCRSTAPRTSRFRWTRLRRNRL